MNVYRTARCVKHITIGENRWVRNRVFMKRRFFQSTKVSTGE
jgi:hypothetical protein